MAQAMAKKLEALDRTGRTLMTVFAKAGFTAIAPAIIQPAGVFLDVIGETLRARTYVFTDPDGDELCMRPDLTVPACRLHLERNPAADVPARYCYDGPAFRFQPQGTDAALAREFRQTGIETFGDSEREEAEADIVGTVVQALEATGLNDYDLRFGDLGLFRALLDASDIPARWRQRLLHNFWHPDAFHAELDRLTTEPGSISKHIACELRDALLSAEPHDAEAIVSAYLETVGLEVVGVRSAAEIAESLLARVADASAEPLPPTTAKLIASYVSIRGPARLAAKRIGDLATAMGVDMGGALASYERRLDRLSNAGVDTDRIEFSAEFGRALEYYTGFVFEVATPALGRANPVAGGGRYDDLMRAVGAPVDVPAVGAAVNTERLLAALSSEGVS